MPRYVSGIPLDNVVFGLDAGRSLGTQSVSNVFLGSGAGRDITNTSGNIILGVAAGDSTMRNNIILSTGEAGLVRAISNEQGDISMVVRSIHDVPDPGSGQMTMDFNRASVGPSAIPYCAA